ncbi:hypothetical protein LTR46_011459 [Exophiala xenobiotica]|nr:hypothetical protein LTR46_011459 [Exophiala xenobiotica]
MFVLEEPESRKRPRSSQEPGDLEPEPIAKKQKSLSESRAQPRHRPASFWDTLSKVRLSRGALREFDRRNIEEKVQPPCTLPPKVEHPTGRARLLLKRFARRGGPDLSHLRGNLRVLEDRHQQNQLEDWNEFRALYYLRLKECEKRVPPAHANFLDREKEFENVKARLTDVVTDPQILYGRFDDIQASEKEVSDAKLRVESAEKVLQAAKKTRSKRKAASIGMAHQELASATDNLMRITSDEEMRRLRAGYDLHIAHKVMLIAKGKLTGAELNVKRWKVFLKWIDDQYPAVAEECGCFARAASDFTPPAARGKKNPRNQKEQSQLQRRSHSGKREVEIDSYEEAERPHDERSKQFEALDRALPGKHTRKVYDKHKRDEAQILAQLRTGKNRLMSALYVIKAADLDHCEWCGPRGGQTLSDGMHALDLTAPTISSGNHGAVDGCVISPGRVNE